MAGIIKVNQYQDFNGNTILTSDGNGNLTTQEINYPMFFVTKSSTQTISDNTFTKITFDNLESDTASGWDTTNNRYTPGVLGKYYIFARMRGNAGGSDQLADINLNIRKNGTTTDVLAHYDANGTAARTSSATRSVEGIVEVTNTSDYFEFYGAIDDTAGSPDIVGDSSYFYTCFSGYRIGS